jgi:catechol 2,3-dioxygenase-like lactoylglutathione lyase family enzyme
MGLLERRANPANLTAPRARGPGVGGRAGPARLPRRRGPSDAFDEQRLGLDHVAFYCDDRGQLEKWQQHLDELGIEHGGIVDAHYGSGLSFRDPDHIALEFFAPAA